MDSTEEKDTSVYFDLINGTYVDANSESYDDGAGLIRIGLDRPALRRVLKWLKDELHFETGTPVEFTPQDDGNVLVEVGTEGVSQRYLVDSEGLPVRR